MPFKKKQKEEGARKKESTKTVTFRQFKTHFPPQVNPLFQKIETPLQWREIYLNLGNWVNQPTDRCLSAEDLGLAGKLFTYEPFTALVCVFFRGTKHLYSKYAFVDSTGRFSKNYLKTCRCSWCVCPAHIFSTEKRRSVYPLQADTELELFEKAKKFFSVGFTHAAVAELTRLPAAKLNYIHSLVNFHEYFLKGLKKGDLVQFRNGTTANIHLLRFKNRLLEVIFSGKDEIEFFYLNGRKNFFPSKEDILKIYRNNSLFSLVHGEEIVFSKEELSAVRREEGFFGMSSTWKHLEAGKESVFNMSNCRRR